MTAKRSIAIAASVLICGYAQSQPEPKDKGAAGNAPPIEGQATGQPKHQQRPTDAFPLPVRVIESPGDAAHSKAREAKADKHDAEDLDAQVRTAEAAEKQALLGFAAAFFSFLSTCLLVWTVRESRRSAKAAMRSVVIAEDAAKKQLRAYVNLFEVSAKWDADENLAARPVQITIGTRNSGQTPAHNVRSWVTADCFASPPDHFARPEFVTPGSLGVQGAGQKNHFTIDRKALLGEGEMSIWARGEEELYVWGEITYLDAFEVERKTSFRLFMPQHGVGADGGKFTSCSEGNEAT